MGGCMTHCRICKEPIGDVFSPLNDNASSTKPIRIPPDDILAQPSSVRRLAMVYRAMNLPRRKVLDFVAGHLFLHEGGIIHQGERVCFEDDLDNIFGVERDPSGRWMSDFLDFAVEPPRQRAQRRVLERLMLLWVAIAIHNPDQAQRIIR